MIAMTILGTLFASGCDPKEGDDPTQKARTEMVETQIAGRGVKDPRVLFALKKIPRHLFVPAGQARYAYDDHPLPIGSGQTISQPYIVAFMTEQLQLKGTERVLEIGTGSGYQAAVLALLSHHVYTIEIRPELARGAEDRLRALGLSNVTVKTGDGYHGLPNEAPFDAIVVTAAPEYVPPPLLAQLAIGGRMVIPVGGFYQELKVIEKTATGIKERSVLPVRFVPFVGEAEVRGPGESEPAPTPVP
jgi:protein-L-isoaspartate(D-aspartate) O-methyltransferase